jgi:hypothetical protein
MVSERNIARGLAANGLLAMPPVIQANDDYPDRHSQEKQDVEKRIGAIVVISHDTELQL